MLQNLERWQRLGLRLAADGDAGRGHVFEARTEASVRGDDGVDLRFTAALREIEGEAPRSAAGLREIETDEHDVRLRARRAVSSRSRDGRLGRRLGLRRLRRHESATTHLGEEMAPRLRRGTSTAWIARGIARSWSRPR